MKSGLSNREKILLLGLAVVVIVYLTVQFAIVPLYDSHEESREELYRLSAERDTYERNISNETLILDGNKDAREKYTEVKKRFPPLMPNEEIDYILTGLCIENGLRPIMLRISDPIPLSETAQHAEGTDEANAVPVFMKVTATMNVNGSFIALEDLVAAVGPIEYMRVTVINYATRVETGASRDLANISVGFELTLINDITP